MKQMQFHTKAVKRILAFTSIATVSVCWSAASVAALPCDQQVARELQSLEVSVGEMTVNGVDHEIATVDLSSNESAESSTATVESISTPTLNLNPRVASILDAVFDVESDTAAENDHPVRIEQDAKDSQSKSAPLTSINDESESIGFHYQMYRKDI